MAFIKPIWSLPSGVNAYTKRQITEAPTKLTAIGMKINDLATDSPLERSANTAMARPNTVLIPVTRTTQRMLFQMTTDHAPMIANNTRKNDVENDTTGSGALRSIPRFVVTLRSTMY